MSEYNMSHTGAELDDAINKVKSGFILPSGTKSITANGTVDVKSFANASVNVPVPSGYVIPSGSANISENGSYDIGGLKTVNINVPVPSGYYRLKQVDITPPTTNDFSYDFGVVPKYVFLFNEVTTNRSSSQSYFISWHRSFIDDEQTIMYLNSTVASRVSKGSSTSTFPMSVSGTTVRFGPFTNTTYNFRFLSGNTYTVFILY